MELNSMLLKKMKNKSSDDTFSQNLNLLRSKDPSLAIHLALSPPQTPSSFLDQSKTESSQKEAQTFSFLHQSEPVTRILFYGAKLTGQLCSLDTWLSQNPKRQLILFEDQIEVYRELFSTELGSYILKHPQINFFFMGIEHFWELKKNKILKLLSQPFLIQGLPSLKKKEKFASFKDKLIALSIDQNIQFAEYLHVSPLMYENILYNLPKIAKSTLLYDLKDQFKNKPAIICGAGPSLNKNGHLLKELKEKALLFAGGRALSVLNDLGVEPHFSIGIDPYEQHKATLRCNNYFELPLIFRLRMFQGATQLNQGSRIYAPGATGYSFVQWIEKSLGLNSPFLDEGLNVVNFNLSVAKILGCNPIILVGSDLAYTDNQAYSKSIPDEQVLPNSFEIDEHDLTLNRGYLKKDAKGQPIFTLWKWVEEAKWIEEFAEKNPDLELINATEGGLKLKGIENLSLEAAKKKHLSISYDYSSCVYQLLTYKTKTHFQISELIKKIEFFYISIQNVEGLLKELQEKKSRDLTGCVLEQELAYIHLLSQLDRLFERVEEEKNPILRNQKKYSFLLDRLTKYKKIFFQFLVESKKEKLST